MILIELKEQSTSSMRRWLLNVTISLKHYSIHLPVRQMKNIFAITLLIFVFVFSITAQSEQTEKPPPTNKPSGQTLLAQPKQKVILRFAKPEQMFRLLEGKWIFADMTCVEPYTVTVSKNKKSIKFQYHKPQKWEDGSEHDSFVYNVLEVGDYYIRAQIVDEKRKTDDGKTVAWDFMFTSADEFVWHRTDWQGLNATPPVTRCKEEKQTALLK